MLLPPRPRIHAFCVIFEHGRVACCRLLTLLSSVADAWRNSGRAAPPSDFVAIASSFFIDYNVFFLLT
jgi:hypothetical protein